MANEFIDLFQQLFYSTEVWGYLGIGITIAFFMVVTYKVKYCFAPFLVILLVMSLEYLDRIASNGYFALHFVITIIGTIIIGYIGIEGIYHHKR